MHAKHLEPISFTLSTLAFFQAYLQLFSNLPKGFVHVDRWQAYDQSSQHLHRGDSFDDDALGKAQALHKLQISFATPPSLASLYIN